MTHKFSADNRVWSRTDRPDEWLATGQLLPGCEFMSVRHSTRHWREQMQEHFTVAAIARRQPTLEAKWHTRGRSVASGSGWLMNINAGDGHSTRSVNVPADFDVVKLSPQIIEEATMGLEMRDFRFRNPTCEEPWVFATIEHLVRTTVGGGELLEVESALVEMVRAIVKHLGEEPSPSGVRPDPISDFRLRRVRDRLRETLCENVRLDELAIVGETSKYQLCRNFTKAFGMSIGVYRTRCRIAVAMQKVIHGELHKSIASELGFSDEPHFSRTFKRQSGLSPGAWRANYLKNSPGRRI